MRADGRARRVPVVPTCGPRMPGVRRVRGSIQVAFLASLVLLSGPLEGVSGQPSLMPIVVPFERAPFPYIVIRLPVLGAPCEVLLFDTGTNTTILAPSLAVRLGLVGGNATAIESLNGITHATKGKVRGIGFDGIPSTGSKVAIAASVAGLRGLAASIAGIYGHDWLAGIDYLIDYASKRIILGSPGTLVMQPGGQETRLVWSGGRPAVVARVRAHTVDWFSARFVLDSAADHVTLFGGAAARLLSVADSNRTMTVDTGFGRRDVSTAPLTLSIGGRDRSVVAALHTEIANRDEDGLLPTSLFRSVSVATLRSIVTVDAPRSSVDTAERTTPCGAAPGQRPPRATNPVIAPESWPRAQHEQGPNEAFALRQRRVSVGIRDGVRRRVESSHLARRGREGRGRESQCGQRQRRDAVTLNSTSCSARTSCRSFAC